MADETKTVVFKTPGSLPNFKVIANWRVVLWQAWSPRFAFITATLAALLPLLPLINEIIYVPTKLMIAAIVVCALATGVSRFIPQKGM